MRGHVSKEELLRAAAKENIEPAMERLLTSEQRKDWANWRLHYETQLEKIEPVLLAAIAAAAQ